MTSLATASKAAASRKKCVTPISRSRNKRSTSRLLAQRLDIGGQRRHLHDLHAPAHASDEGRVLVAAEIVPGLGAQQRVDARQVLAPVPAQGLDALSLADLAKMPGVFDEPCRHVLDRQHAI